ncbi:MAG: DEAD/DEAH box helicase, partial [Phycisphaerales bacterium]|nr:DEAD/DEAH box helicase [Phycisphaerales bacterium]
GKTAAFAIPILQELHAKGPQGAKKKIKTLILTPTRELAIQIGESFSAYGRHLQLKHTVIFGGVGQKPQTDALHRGVDTVVATPGRLLDLMGQGYIHLNDLEIFVLDEADRMLDMGFLPALKKILGLLPTNRQSLMFSATFADEIRQLANSFLRDPEQLQIASRNAAATQVAHRVHPVDAGAKKDALLHLLASDSRRQTLVFARTKHGSDKLVRWLLKSGLKAAAIHGNKSQNARTRALDAFRSGRTAVLVATDVAARGIDVDGITHVFNFDIPMDPETYVHRIGRTARAGASGVAVSFCSIEEAPYLRAIERLIGTTLAVDGHSDRPVRKPAGVAVAAAPRANDAPKPATAPAPARSGKKRRRVHRSEIGLAAPNAGASTRKPRTRSARSR